MTTPNAKRQRVLVLAVCLVVFVVQRSEVVSVAIDHHFSGPYRAIGALCESVCFRIIYEMSFDVDMWHAGSSGLCLGQFRRSWS